MTTTIWLVHGLALLGFLGYRAVRVWLDTGRRVLPPAQRLGWALAGAFIPDRYWWEARIEGMTVADMARRLQERGFAQVRAPMSIVDSFLPPDNCRAFRPERKRLKLGGVDWPDAQRTALLRLLAPATHSPAKDPGHLPQDEDLWLL